MALVQMYKTKKGFYKIDTKYSTVGHKSHDPCFHKKYIEEGFMNFVAHCTYDVTEAREAEKSNSTQSHAAWCGASRKQPDMQRNTNEHNTGKESFR